MITFLKLGDFGRMGNQLFQVAATIAIARRAGQLAIFPEWDHPFTTEFAGLCDHQVDDFDRVVVPWGYHDVAVPPHNNITLEGYFQSEKYFIDCQDWIRELFTFRFNPSPPVDGDWIAVHVRRGDYLQLRNHYHILGQDYYNRAIEKMPDLPLVLFSDDMDLARELIPQAIPYHSPNGWYDMAVMAKAPYHIIANSSFSWWGAWLAKSWGVIAPGKWFEYKSPYSTEDLFPPGWEIIY